MISCIICSRKQSIFNKLLKNISETIGSEYEIIQIDNSNNKYSIFSAYNEGVKRSKGDILCFMHEDILLHTNSWGEKVTQMLRKDKIGILGVIGSHIITNNGNSWYYQLFNTGTIIQGKFLNGKYSSAYIHKQDIFPFENHLLEAACIDGLWFCIPKQVFQRYLSFDAETYGFCFHAYDLDICMQVISSGYKVYVSDAILIEHFSEGFLSNQWKQSIEKFQRKWNSYLPIVKIPPINNLDNTCLKCNSIYESLFIENLKLENKIAKYRNTFFYKIAIICNKVLCLLRLKPIKIN